MLELHYHKSLIASLIKLTWISLFFNLFQFAFLYIVVWIIKDSSCHVVVNWYIYNVMSDYVFVDNIGDDRYSSTSMWIHSFLNSSLTYPILMTEIVTINPVTPIRIHQEICFVVMKYKSLFSRGGWQNNYLA